MAEKVGIDRSFLADVERGKRNASLLNLELIAMGCGSRFRNFWQGCSERKAAPMTLSVSSEGALMWLLFRAA